MSVLDHFLTITRQIILSTPHSPQAIAHQTAVAMDRLLQQHLPSATGFAEPGSWNGKLLYTDERTGYILVLMTWGAGAVTPIHDHGTWGVVGVLSGQLRCTNFVKIHPDRNTVRGAGGQNSLGHSEVPGHDQEEVYPVRAVNSFVASPGDVSYLYPPDQEIHQIQNPTEEVVHSLHVYGYNIGF